MIFFKHINPRHHFEEALWQGHRALQANAEELGWFDWIAVGHELRIIELEKEINELCVRIGRAGRYPIEFEQGKHITHA